MKCADYFWLRSAGFPADTLLQTTDLTESAEFRDYARLLQQQGKLQQQFQHHILEQGEEQCRKFLRKLIAYQSISISDLPVPLRTPLAKPLEEWQSTNQAIALLDAKLHSAFAEFKEQVHQRLIDFLARPDVMEAIFISNPDAAQRIQSLVTDRHGVNDSRKKQKLRLGWSYAQRFCTKNDTCSFFGPIVWGRFADDQLALVNLHWEAGPWLAQRETFFESWVLQRLVVQLNGECPQPERLPLTLNPGCYLNGTVLHYPLGKFRHLHEPTLTIIREIQSAPRSTESLASRLGNSCLPLIDHLVTSGILQRGFQLSPRDPAAFGGLLLALQTASMPTEFIAQWSARFQTLEAQREIYAKGNLSHRQRALSVINQTLLAAGISLTRESGKMYVGRYPLYEDCSRASKVSFNRVLQQQLNNDFSPLMALYRWLTRTSAVLLHQAWLVIYQTIQQEKNGEHIDLLTFLQRIQPQQTAIQQRILQTVRSMLHDAWQPLLTTSTESELHLSAQQLEQIVATLYQQCPAAQDFPVFGDEFHSPDFMISAIDLEALNRGEYWLILGETHPGVHTLSQPVAAPFCPFITEIDQSVNTLLGHERVILADSPESYQRSHIDWPLVERYAQLILPSGGGCVATSKRYPIGRARLLLKAGRLVVQDIEGKFQEDLLCVCNTSLHQILFQLAGDVLPRQDPRRIRVNQTVYKRRTWTFIANEWPTLANDDFVAFIQWYRWQQQQGLPRWVFIKCDSEPKPLFVDFENPLSLDVLATALKKAQTIQISEMLPAPDGLWMKDARGRVCCEVRTTFSANKQEVSTDAK
jgi:hypothetical protein